MKVEIFCLCDFAQPTRDGKLNILGLFDMLPVEQVPTRHGLFAVAIKLRIENADAGEKKFKISFFDPEGKPILTGIEAVMNVETQPGLPNSNIQMVSLIPQLPLASLGEYSIVLEVDGQPVASTPLLVIQIQSLLPHLRPPLQTA